MKTTEILDQIKPEELIDYIANNANLTLRMITQLSSEDKNNKHLQYFVDDGKYSLLELVSLIKKLHFEQIDIDETVEFLLHHTELDLKDIFRAMTKNDSSGCVSEKIIECIGLNDKEYHTVIPFEKKVNNITKDLLNDIAVHFGIFETLESLTLNKDEILRAIQTVLGVNQYYTKGDIKQLIDEL